jgi:hypothetical protein
MASFEEDLRKLRGDTSSNAEEFLQMRNEHARISRERAAGFVALMRDNAVEPLPLRAKIVRPAPKRGGLLRPRQEAGYDFPEVGRGWGITEFLAKSDTHRYPVVLENADTVECFDGTPGAPNQPTTPYHDAVFAFQGGALKTEDAPFFHERDYELLQRAALRFLNE